MRFTARRALPDRAPGVAEPQGEEVLAAAPLVPLRTLFRRFWRETRPYRAWLGLLLLVAALGPAVDAAQIWLLRLVVDDALGALLYLQ
ncbi:MAG: hypothetical protein ICV64_10690 [Thermoleophilia bacterium]|nr:hypothetical protein [Thermoleophilia bacterium]